MQDEIILKKGIRNDPVYHIWVWDFFFAYSLFFNKYWKVSISWNFSSIFQKSRFAWKHEKMAKKSCSLAKLWAESFFGRFFHWMYSTVLTIRKKLKFLAYRLKSWIKAFTFGFGKWLNSVGYSLFFLLN